MSIWFVCVGKCGYIHVENKCKIFINMENQFMMIIVISTKPNDNNISYEHLTQRW